MLATLDTTCPYCGEVISLVVDGSAGDQRYIEDCSVCCRPITVIVDVDHEGDIDLRVQSESET
ncbi:CPXCG motif-containing cysteine-rich protein [Lysobacter sp. TY2-98]|uniref:CPXCG motif-containing cysteine-rich protein n=1 Tax=Lysobacter sp. TY2-98 TaxID=2290922 RepID=UPI000E2078E1|nr:CPXCG motif-containing cysteine-rich protein [Lysobacter sp. TY2-98]AXK73686.1 CPXCG motif-containing cysteine-rich protein [Lysobacter sp. TY2-98]